MPNLIQILPPNISNQIAAGEVVQRPASVVKELIENAIDAKATHIQLNIKDAGKTLIQVIDNGTGMNEEDALISFERHATSKIKTSEDLFHLTTMGFRGEALASIAAIAHVEMKTKQENQELGTFVEMEGNVCKNKTPIACEKGTSISVKNLFYNVPARRNFLKTDPIENNHILEEFIRTALINNDIAFTYYNNGKLIHKLDKQNLKKRIIDLFGKAYNERLLPIEEEIDAVITASVVPDVMYSLNRAISKYLSLTAVNVEYGIETGIKILTDHPAQVGADRVVDAVAAYEIYGGPVLIIDFGTATTYDVVSEHGEFLAGITAPGIQTSAEALWSKAAKLPRIEIAKPKSILAKDTVTSMQARLDRRNI